MFAKHPTWTRTRVGRNRVHWVAYDDRPGEGNPGIVDQGYGTSLVEADTAAREALAAAGMHHARRMSKGFGPPVRRGADASAKPPRPEPARRREYLYTRHPVDGENCPLVAAHLVCKRTARRVYVTRKSCGPDQIGTDDENWTDNERTISLDRMKLERDGSAFTGSYRQSEFYLTREAALGDDVDAGSEALAELGLAAPCTIDEIKAAYRLKAFQVHPDRGGNTAEFRGVEAAYRRLLREAQTPEA